MARRFCCFSSEARGHVRRDPIRAHSNAQTIYTWDELRRATKNFSSANVIGKGHFATVYRGKLRNENGASSVVAIKRYNAGFSKEFQVELGALSRLNHRNVVRCLGSCILKDEKLIVLEHLHHGSLYSYIQYHKPLLCWGEKLMIALGIAEGLKYLRVANVIHRDPNSSNILLDKALVPKIGDFSLSLKAFRVKEEEGMHIPVAGTKGYLAPEGTVSSAMDVYVFGVVLMELITEQPPIGPSPDSLLVTEISRKNSNMGNRFHLAGVVSLCSALDTSSTQVATELALRCTESGVKKRPTLTEIISILEEALRLQANDIAGRRFDTSQTFLL